MANTFLLESEWDKVGKRFYEIGCDRGVFFPLKKNADTEEYEYVDGEAWSGLSNVTLKPEGGDVNDIWADNMKYLSVRAAEKFGATIECYTYPDGFKACNGEAEVVTGVTINGQTRSTFGFSYRSKVGNDTEGHDFGYKIHLIYNATASPVETSHATVNDSTDIDAMSYDIDTTAINVGTVNGIEYKPTSHIEIESSKFADTAAKAKLLAFEKILYGTPASTPQGEDPVPAVQPRMPLPAEVFAMLGTSGNTQGGNAAG
jgi:hypothetical protein